ncbi:MAG: SpoIID/LytB domain-containing protein [Spirulinaceae cyanobacterium]
MTSQGSSVSFTSLLKQLLLLGSRHWWLSFLIWIVLVGPAQAAFELRVAIKDGVNQLNVGSSTSAVIKNEAGQQIGQIGPMNSVTAVSGGNGVQLEGYQAGQIWIEPTGDGTVWIGDRWYRGDTQLVPNGKGLTVINHVDIEDYLYSVVGAEMYASWPQEALKSQAVSARTYALHKSAKSNSSLYDLDTTTATQVYKGLNSETNTTVQAVDATRNQVLTYNGEPILAVFHASSGGHTENVEDIWSNPLPYLRGVVDYDNDAPVYQWTKNFSRGQMSQLVGGVGTISSITPVKVTPQGRIVTMKAVGSSGTKEVSGAQLRKVLDLRSTLFSISVTGDGFQVSGRGFGHGVGLSQWGARNLAQQGVPYEQILSHYYQGANLSLLEE